MPSTHRRRLFRAPTSQRNPMNQYNNIRTCDRCGALCRHTDFFSIEHNCQRIVGVVDDEPPEWEIDAGDRLGEFCSHRCLAASMSNVLNKFGVRAEVSGLESDLKPCCAICERSIDLKDWHHSYYAPEFTIPEPDVLGCVGSTELARVCTTCRPRTHLHTQFQRTTTDQIIERLAQWREGEFNGRSASAGNE
jgi:hypothetical protein